MSKIKFYLLLSNLEKDYLFGVANEASISEEKELVWKISQPNPCIFRGDRRA